MSNAWGELQEDISQDSKREPAADPQESIETSQRENAVTIRGNLQEQDLEQALGTVADHKVGVGSHEQQQRDSYHFRNKVRS